MAAAALLFLPLLLHLPSQPLHSNPHPRRLLRGHHRPPSPPPSILPVSFPPPPAPIFPHPPSSSLAASPAQPPAPAIFPKYPSSANPTPFYAYPFFPSFATPPPPDDAGAASGGTGGGVSTPTTTLPTFPANISSLVSSPPRAGARFRLFHGVLLILLSVVLLSLSALLALHLRRRRLLRRPAAGVAGSAAGDDEVRLKPPPPPSSSTPSTEFLYLGTLVTPRARADDVSTSYAAAGMSGGADSPELRPLPPLPRVVPGLAGGARDSGSRSSDPMTDPCAGSTTSSSTSVAVSASSPRPPPLPHAPKRGKTPSPPKRRQTFAAEKDLQGKKAMDFVPPTVTPRKEHSWNPFIPAMPVDEKEDDNPRRKLRPLHANKLYSATLQTKEDVIEGFLMSNAAKESGWGMFAARHDSCVFDEERARTVNALARAIMVSKEQVCQALWEGDIKTLGADTLRTLMKMFPTNAEEVKLRALNDALMSSCCPAEVFLKSVVAVPNAFKRLDAMLYIATFNLKSNYIRSSFATLEAACEDLRTSRLLHILLETSLRHGSHLNLNVAHYTRGSVLQSLMESVEHKADKRAFFDLVIQEVANSESCHSRAAASNLNLSSLPQYACDEHQVITNLEAELVNVKRAAAIDLDELSGTLSELALGQGKIHDVLRLNSAYTSNEMGLCFFDAMSRYLGLTEDVIRALQAQECTVISSLQDVSEYFYEDSGGIRPELTRIFAAVSQFLCTVAHFSKGRGNGCINQNAEGLVGRLL